MSEAYETVDAPDAPAVETPAPAEPAKKEIVLTDEEREAFFKAFLTDEPYHETVKLFHGKTKVVFRTLNIDENDEVFRQISYDQAKGIASSDDSYYVKIVEYRLASSIVSMDDKPFCEDITPESHPDDAKTGKTYLMERLKVMQKWNTFKLGGVTAAFNHFESKVRALTDDSVKGNF